ncbi:thiol-disulfide isomerase/thioredoxin [Chryseobacterium ginsenosidimutans]|uniref:TlpA disulfide reductase family protein n=1 Tax=Chryseobacterium ginsenosidimutans TaxID=687846 RepID=UPI00216A1AB9|nr:TlpA disulfide reductase family protein [Chryseobacterium ginsenosidimutans]MCS3868153.1 thiol-disulfide isomerase/thioredoxin [Chryseobacterium ginsenosidimutans]
MRKNFLFILVIFLLQISCNEKNSTSIKGSIPNLPDGTMYMWEEGPANKIDSSITHNGNFKISHEWNENKEPNIIGIYHIDKSGIKRLFNFTTNASYNGTPGWSTNVFYSDTIISLNGKFKENLPITGYELLYNIKDVSGVAIKAGRQTEAYYNIDGDLFQKIDDKTIQTVRDKISKYPYSYHLLYQIIENKNNFSAEQVANFLKSFKGEIINSKSYKNLLAYNQKRIRNDKIPLSQLEDIKGKKSEIFDKNYDKHLIIFWASWCGPCRKEIPLLKTMNKKLNSTTEFISISIDDDKNAWKNAVNKEQMSWKQFILDKNTPAYENFQIRLKLNSAIPYTVLVDNNLKILKSTVGLSSEKEIESMIK